MKPSAIPLCVAAGLLIGAGWARAQNDEWMPYVVGRQYSATEVVSSRGRPPVETQVYVDGDKIRTEQMTYSGGKVLAIIRPDLGTVYWVILARKQLLMLPFDADRIKTEMPPPTLAHAEALGFQTIFGVACAKFRLTNDSGRRFLLWTNQVTSLPVKMMADGGGYMQVWKNYLAGPQDPALFQPPDDYNDVVMPLPPSMRSAVTLPPKLNR